MPRPSITSEKKAQMRSDIRAAMVRLIRRRQITPGDVEGYQSISIRDVAKEAEISVGTLYKYFENSADLRQSLWLEPVEALKSNIQSNVDEAREPVEKIRVLLEGYVKFSIENPRVFKAAFLFIRPEQHPKPERVSLEHEMFYRNLKTTFEAGQDLGLFKAFDTHVMAQIFWASIHGALGLPENLDRYDFDDVETLTGNMIETLLDLIIDS